MVARPTISYQLLVKKSVISQLTVRILTNSQLSIKPQPEPSHGIGICDSLVR